VQVPRLRRMVAKTPPVANTFDEGDAGNCESMDCIIYTFDKQKTENRFDSYK